MGEDQPEKPSPPNLPTYVRDPLASQSPERLETIAAYASELTAWKRHQQAQERDRRHAEDALDADELAALDERGIATDPTDYEGVLSGAYITVKTTKQTSESAYRYYYWQWREGDTWKNKYIAPVSPKS